MRKATPLPVALAILSLARPALATDKPECGLEAFKEYNVANVALLMKDSPFMKADTLIAQRRLEETYCLKEAKCAVETGAPQTGSLEFDLAFSRCLKEEAMEKYEATPRTNE